MKFIFIMFLLFVVSCGGKTENVSFSNDIKPILDENCTICHNSEDDQKNLNFESYESLMNSRYLNRNQALIIPGDSEVSRIYLVTHSNKSAIRMPPESFGFDKLSESQIQKIKVWIDEGAKNN
ncbi:MAG: hypothetical protein K9J12_10185 [Melioribacteraceae bacterium]|nr:hypothetical protein [Melioribacteraceae bacterium]